MLLKKFPIRASGTLSKVPAVGRFPLRRTGLAAALLCGLGAVHSAHAAPPAEWAKGRVIVQARAGLSEAEVGKIAGTHGGKPRRIGKSDLYIIDLPASASETAVHNLLAHNPKFKFAELDGKLAPTLVTNDPYLGSQWHLTKINAGVAWDSSTGAGITVAILDSGILSSHPDLAPILVPGWNFVDNNNNLTDVTGHGTTVAGAAAAIANNGLGVSGVAGSAKIMPLRVADATGYAYYSTVAQAVTHAADNGARVANASYGGIYASAAVQSAAQYLKGKGGLLVVSAGNSAANDGAPATSTMIPVSATDGNDARASWSSFGSYVALSAPGVGIWTTNVNGSYSSASGTSFSAPITAGTIALVMSVKPTLSAAQVESILYSTAVDLGTAGRDIYFGHGRINAAAAVAAAMATTASDTQAPAVSIAAPLANSTASGLANVDVTASDNVGVTRVDLKVNGVTVATDTSSPFQFSWDTTSLSNGMASVVAVAYDAAGNAKSSTAVSVNVANNLVADTTAPVVAIKNPVNGSKVTGTVAVSVAASDNNGAAGITQKLYVNGALAASATGATLAYKWNTIKLKAGLYTLQAEAVDAAGNKSVNVVQVSK